MTFKKKANFALTEHGIPSRAKMNDWAWVDNASIPPSTSINGDEYGVPDTAATIFMFPEQFTVVVKMELEDNHTVSVRKTFRGMTEGQVKSEALDMWHNLFWLVEDGAMFVSNGRKQEAGPQRLS